MLLSTLGASLLGNLLTCKSTNWAGEGTVRAGKDFWCPPSTQRPSLNKFWNTKVLSKQT